MVKQIEQRFKEDVVIPTICGRCYAGCGIRVRRVNGVAVKIEGTQDSGQGARGGVCAKGLAALQVLYDPNRLNVPLKRTNPEKGLFADPKWQEISWDDALDEISGRLTKILEDNPKKLLYVGTTVRASYSTAFRNLMGQLFKGPNMFFGGGGLHCGMGAHVVGGLVHGSWSIVPDFKYCNYAIYFGANKGSGSGHSAMATTRLAAEARDRGMRFVAFDPMCNFAGSKANEWVPIIPGTDGAVALAMVNIIVNDLGVWDDKYIKYKSNGPYLIGPDKRYVRDEATSAPLIWDPVDRKAKVYDEADIKDFALEGIYEVNGTKCQPAFQLLRKHLKQYTPKMASEVSSVPEKTIRRIAKEFLEAARIGSTITIEGKEFPYRPASAVIFRGGEGHENSHHTCFAVALLNQVIGGADVPGGTLGWPKKSLGSPETGKPYFTPFKGRDGFLAVDRFGPSSGFFKHAGPWPTKMPEKRQELSMTDIFTLAPFSFAFASDDQEELWQKVDVPYRPEMLLTWGCNMSLSIANQETIDKVFKKIPFTVVSEIFRTEFADGFADILLPDTCFLEESNWSEGLSIDFNHSFGTEDWYFHIVQPVVEPKAQRRQFAEVVLQIIDKMGMTSEFNEVCNEALALEEAYKIKPDEKLTWCELGDRVMQNLFGPRHNWEWFKKHGFLTYHKKPEEAYWRYDLDVRTPIYLEYMVDIGEKIKEITSEIGMDIDLSQYTPFIKWTSCSIHRVDDPKFDLYCFSYRDVLHSGSHTNEQPWLDEASQMNPYTYNITMNRQTARKKGLRDGDIIQLESVSGRKICGPVKTMLGQHPQTVAIAGCGGHWGDGMPIAKGKATNFDTLLELDLQHVDPVSFNIETAVRVKVSKQERR